MKTLTHDWELHQGAAVDELIPVTGLPITGVGVRCHIRDTLDALAPRLILSHDGPTNRRVSVSAEGLRIQIGATVSGGLVMVQPRNRWVYDVEVYSLTDADDVLKPFAGTVYAYREATRESDTTALPPLASGDGRYLRIDGDQGLTPEQQAWAQHNAGSTPGGPGGSGDDGWSPILAVVTDGARRVHQIADWTGGEGTKPATGGYIGASGIVALIGDAVDIRGAEGAAGTAGPQGPAGATGAAGPQGPQGPQGPAGVDGADGADGDAANIAAEIHAAAEKTTPADDDELGIIDSAASWVLKRLKWSAIKAALKSFWESSTPPYVEWGASADKTLALTDANVDQWCNNGSTARVINIPANSSVALAIGTKIPIVRLGSGTCTIDAATGVTLNGVSGGSCTITRYQGALLTKTGTDAWIVSGDVSAVA